MFRGLTVAVLLTLPVPVRAADTAFPADVASDLERLAAELDESLRCLPRDEALQRELHLIAADMQLQALRCAIRESETAATHISVWVSRLERTSTDRQALRVLCDELTDELDFQRLRRRIAEVRESQRSVVALLDRLRWESYPSDPPIYDQGKQQPRLGEVPLIVVPAGSVVKVRHTIHWRQYPHDTLTVELTASPGVSVPSKLMLDFEKHDVRFEYELRVEKLGDYVVRLTPEIGEDVLVYVSVR